MTIKIKGVLLVLGLGVLVCCTKKPVSLVVLETTDLHGAYVQDFAGGAGYIRQIQQEYKGRMLLLDCGDNLQGTPEVYYSNYIDTAYTHIFSEYVNWAGYDALTIGNHDVEAGQAVYNRVYSKVKMPVLCANAIDIRTQKPYFKPYAVFKRKGYKIAVLGLLLPDAVDWISLEDMGHVTFMPLLPTAQKWVQILQETEHPDVIIGLFHAGFKDVKEIAQTVPGFNLICCGHVHHAGFETVVSSSGEVVQLMDAGARGSHIARADIQLTRVAGSKKPNVEVTTQLLVATNLPDFSEPTLAHTEFVQRLQEYMAFPVCFLPRPVYSKNAMFGPSGWVDETHRATFEVVQQYASNIGIDVSFSAPAYRNLRLKKGVMTMRDFITFYPYENKMVILSMTGSEIIRYLEYAYMLRLDRPDGPSYHFDSAAGIRYNVYRERPYGERIEVLSMADGRPFDTTATYHVAMTEFRGQGGGGHLTEGVGLSKEEMQGRLLWKSEKDMRQLLVQRALLASPLLLEPLNQWRYL